MQMNDFVIFSVFNHATTLVKHANVYSLFIFMPSAKICCYDTAWKYAHVFLLLISYAVPSAKNNDMLL